MDIEIVKSLAAMEEHKAEWDGLFQSAMYKSIFGEPDFCLNWLEHFGKIKLQTPKGTEADRGTLRPARPILVLARNNGRLDAVLPLRIVPTRSRYMYPTPYPKQLGMMPTLSLQGLINSHSLSTNILIRAGSELFAQEAISRLLTGMRWQSIDLGIVPADSKFSDLLGASLDEISTPVLSTRWKVEEVRFAGTYEEFLLSRPPLKKTIERARRRLERDFGPISLEWWTGAEATEIGFPAFVEVDSQSWKARQPEGEALCKTPAARAYYAGLTRRYAEKSRAHVWGLRLNGELAAAQLCFESNGVLYGYKTSFKEAYAPKAECRPGFVLLSMIVERAWKYFSALNPMGGSLQEKWHSTEEGFMRCQRMPRHRWHRLLTPLVGN